MNKWLQPAVIGRALGPLLFFLVQFFWRPDGLSEQGVSALAVALWVGAWWVTEAVPIAVSALLPIILFPLSGALDLAATTVSYGHKYVFLYLGGFF